jgi:hypothetical protein
MPLPMSEQNLKFDWYYVSEGSARKSPLTAEVLKTSINSLYVSPSSTGTRMRIEELKRPATKRKLQPLLLYTEHECQ